MRKVVLKNKNLAFDVKMMGKALSYSELNYVALALAVQRVLVHSLDYS